MFFFAYLDNLGILEFLYAIHIVVLILAGLVLVPVFVVTILAFFAFKQAD